VVLESASTTVRAALSRYTLHPVTCPLKSARRECEHEQQTALQAHLSACRRSNHSCKSVRRRRGLRPDATASRPKEMENVASVEARLQLGGVAKIAIHRAAQCCKLSTCGPIRSVPAGRFPRTFKYCFSPDQDFLQYRHPLFFLPHIFLPHRLLELRFFLVQFPIRSISEC